MKHVGIRAMGPRLARAGIVPLLAMAVACGGNESTASKSAAAFDEAAKKGMAPGAAGDAHGGHVAPAGAAHGDHDMTASSTAGDDAMADMDHSTMPGMNHSGGNVAGSMAGMDHSKMTDMGGMDHSRTSGRASSRMAGMAGMDHSKMPGTAGMDHAKGGPAMAGMDHSAMAGMNHGAASAMPGMGHDMSAMGAPRPPIPEPALTVARPGQPAATLRSDDIDAPAPTAIRDASRAGGMDMAGMSHGTYRQTDAGRDVAREPMATPMTGGHEGHQMPPATAPPMPAAHAGHGQPASPRSPAPTISPKPAPAPAGSPHDMHAMPSPQPLPSPSPGGNQ